MKLIVGLGNVGEKYDNTRHNVGWLVLDKLKQEISKSEFLISKQTPNLNFQINKSLESIVCLINTLSTTHQSLILAKPTTMMNNSGAAVAKLTSFYHIETSNLWVIHDDLDIKLGQYKIQFGTGPKVHNGLNSIYEKLGTKDFWHVRVGVDTREAENRTPGDVYVLENFSEDEEKVIEDVSSGILKELSGMIFK